MGGAIFELLRDIALRMSQTGGLITLLFAWTLMFGATILLTVIIVRKVDSKQWARRLPEQARLKLLDYQLRAARLERENAKLRE